MKIRFLVPSDLVVYKQLRLTALQESPTAFGSDYDFESKFTNDQFIARMSTSDEPANGIFGAFTDMGQLAGMLGFSRMRGVKRRHGAELWSAYVGAPFRRRGIARDLLDAAILHAHKLGLRYISLTVTSGNHAARKLYISREFRIIGTVPEELYFEGVYYDLEYMVLKLG
jgi:ribosomal protein S18 acetylase RimI-like enzyme